MYDENQSFWKQIAGGVRSQLAGACYLQAVKIVINAVHLDKQTGNKHISQV